MIKTLFVQLGIFSGDSFHICNFTDRAGGVCADSFNSGIVTTNNYGENVSPVVSHLTFAHELGHSFGSRVSIR